MSMVITPFFLRFLSTINSLRLSGLVCQRNSLGRFFVYAFFQSTWRVGGHGILSSVAMIDSALDFGQIILR